MKLKLSLALVALATLSACVSSPPPRQMASAPAQPQGVEGTWADPNGLISTFSGGRFETRTADGTNTQMASGTYSSQPNSIIQINLYSNTKKTTSLVNCSLVASTQLNCTSQAGQQFSLSRRS